MRFIDRFSFNSEALKFNFKFKGNSLLKLEKKISTAQNEKMWLIYPYSRAPAAIILMSESP
jgi:hypothetical protein